MNRRSFLSGLLAAPVVVPAAAMAAVKASPASGGLVSSAGQVDVPIHMMLTPCESFGKSHRQIAHGFSRIIKEYNDSSGKPVKISETWVLNG